MTPNSQHSESSERQRRRPVRGPRLREARHVQHLLQRQHCNAPRRSGEDDTMVNSPVGPANVICFQRIFSIMDSYGPVCFTKIIGVNDETIDIPPQQSFGNAVLKISSNGTLSFQPAMVAELAPGRHFQLATTTRKSWPPGRELKIGFKGGSRWQKVGYFMLYSCLTCYLLAST